MDGPEFKRFLKLCTSTFSFVDKLDRDDEKDRFRMWKRALEPVPYKRAEDYVAAIVAGRVAMPRYPSEWDSFASDCRAWCHVEESRRRPPAPKEKPAPNPNRQAEVRQQFRESGVDWIVALADKLDRERPLIR